MLVARVTIDPTQVAAFESVAGRQWEATHRAEPGCHRYEYVRLVTPGEYLALMEFDDHAAFLRHQASEHHERMTAEMRPYMRQVSLEFGRSVDGAFGVPPGGVTDQSVVDPDAEQRYAARFPAPAFSAWGR